MNQPIPDIIRRRFSCRSYLDLSINSEHRQALNDILSTCITGPMGTHSRFELVAATQDDSRALKGLGTYGFIKHPAAFIIGAIEQGAKDLEDYGYILEHIVLSATDIGLGTCWLGGSFTKSNFARKILKRENEIIPAVVSTGYIEEKSGVRDQVKSILKYHRRFPAERLFFTDKFGDPLKAGETDTYTVPLEMVRIAPSASNKQPWRIVQEGNAWHFYLQRTKNYGKGTLLFKFLRLADLQRVDMGIAMCHFELSARSLGLKGRWSIEDPVLLKDRLQIPENTEYTVSWINE